MELQGIVARCVQWVGGKIRRYSPSDPEPVLDRSRGIVMENCMFVDDGSNRGIEINEWLPSTIQNNIAWDGKDTPENRALLREWLDRMDPVARESWLKRLAFDPYSP